MACMYVCYEVALYEFTCEVKGNRELLETGQIKMSLDIEKTIISFMNASLSLPLLCGLTIEFQFSKLLRLLPFYSHSAHCIA